MKIAVNTRLLLPNKLEGIGWFTYETLKRIVLNHPEHQFYFLFDRPYSQEFIFASNVTPVVINPPSRHPILWYIWFEFSVKRALKRIGADLFLSPDGYLSLSSKIKSISVIHDINFEHHPEQFRWSYKKYFLYFFPKYAAKANRIITVSEYSKSDIASSYNVNPDKIDVAHNGANLVYRPLSDVEKADARHQFANGCNYFIYIGALLPRKNVARLLKAFDKFKEVTKTDIKMFNTHDIEQVYREMKYKHDVIFAGRLIPGEIELALGGALALTYVSYFEGFGIPLIEAMQAEVPVITSNVTSLPEVAGDAALLVDPYSVHSICDAMLKVFEDLYLRNNLVEKGRLQRKKFNWDNTAARVWESIEKCIAE
jgi:glycosyltransferase involved in cell wall biosynthesis